jgi:YVTN family beta-propeller protein
MSRLTTPKLGALLVALLLCTNGAARADTVVANIAVGSTPMDVAVSPNSQTVYATNNGSSTVSVINASTNTVIATTAVPAGSVTNLAVRPTNDKVYVVSQNSNTIQILSTAGPSYPVIGSIGVGPTPIDVAFDPAGSFAYVTNYFGPSLMVINASTNAVVSTIPLHEGPRGVVAVNVPGVGLRVFVALAGPSNSEIARIDPATGSVTYLSVSGNPFFVAATPDGAKLFASLSAANQTAALSTNPFSLLTTIADAGGGPFGVAVAATPTGDRAFVADSTGTGFGYDVTRIDAAGNTFLGSLFVSSKPKGVAASPNGTRVYVAASGASRVNVIDTTF